MKLVDTDILYIVSAVNALAQNELERHKPATIRDASIQAGRIAGMLHVVALMVSEGMRDDVDNPEQKDIN